MIHGLADQTVLLMCDKAAAEGIDDICRAADRRACTANHSAAIGLAPRSAATCGPRDRRMYFCRASGLCTGGAGMP